MCGRFALNVPWKTVVALLEAQPVDDADWLAQGPTYNICPTDPAPIVRLGADGRREAAVFRWGLVPFWAKDPKIGARMINARAETVATSKAFAEPFAQRRCLVPASGFYEWTTEPDGGGKQPHWIHAPDGAQLTFAGIWSTWRDRATGDARPTFSVITTDASDDVRPLHDRMPVILADDARDRWLDPDTAPEHLQALLAPYARPLAHFEVSKAVNNVRADGPTLIAPRERAPENLELAL